MAWEKLILKSVMYGVDKVPDSWFEKVPGGYYKAAQKADDKTQAGEKSNGGSSGNGKKPRRYSHHQDDRRHTRRDRYEEEYRSRRQERRGRSSYDGNDDEDFDRDDRRGAAKDGGRRRRRHSVDSERYGHNDDDDCSATRRNAYYSDRKHYGDKQPRPKDPYFDNRQRPVTAESSRAANPFPSKSGAAAGMGSGIAGAAAAEKGAPYPQSRPSSSHSSADMPAPQVKPDQPPATYREQSGSTTNRYVPYAHIYGEPEGTPQPKFAPPPINTSGSKQPRNGSQPSSPNATQPNYQQNPFASRVPTAPDTGAGVQYGRAPTFPLQSSGATGARAFAGYENTASYPESPRPGRSTDKYSPSYASHDKHNSDLRRARSERRQGTGDGRQGDKFVDPQAGLRGQMPPLPAGPAPTSKDTRRDSGHDRDSRRYYRHNDRGYTSD